MGKSFNINMTKTSTGIQMNGINMVGMTDSIVEKHKQSLQSMKNRQMFEPKKKNSSIGTLS